MFGRVIEHKLAPCTQNRIDDAMSEAMAMRASVDRLTISVNALHATVLVLAIAAGAYLLLRKNGHG